MRTLNGEFLFCSSNKEILKEASRALNILYTYDKTYEAYLIYWLLPLQVCTMELMWITIFS